MDINILVQRLKHGESFAAQNSEGKPYQVNRPPSQLSINAAKVIIALDQQVQQLNTALLNVQNQLNQLLEEYEQIKNKHSSGSSGTNNESRASGV
jgi:hypothetical protein